MMKYFLPFLLLFAIGAISWQVPSGENWKEKVNGAVIRQAMTNGSAECIVQLTEQADVAYARQLPTKEARAQYVYETLKATADRTQANLIALLEEKGVAYRSFYITNALYLEADLALLKELAGFPEVAHIQFNPWTKLEVEESAPVLSRRGADSIEWGIEWMMADSVWALGYNGQDVVVGGQDTGYEWDHPALKEMYRGWKGGTTDTVEHNYNWHDAIRMISPLHGDSVPDPSLNPCGLDVKIPCDDHNHGTHTMGTMVGREDGRCIGVAPGAKWMACRNMERGYGSPASYIECFEWFMAPTDLDNENPDPSKAPHVINNSWSCPEMEGCNDDNFATMYQVIENLKASGVVVVVSAGNSGRAGCATVNAPPAFFDNVISVGAVNRNSEIAAFSSRGPSSHKSGLIKPDLVAPGVGIPSSVRNDGYRSFSGTSMAGPHIAGVVALMISANPSLAGQVETIERLLLQVPEPYEASDTCGGVPGTAIPNNTFGWGGMNALTAVQSALQTVSNNELENDLSVSLFPNPTSGYIDLQLTTEGGPTTFQLFASDGKKIIGQQWDLQRSDQRALDLSDLPIGIYYYQLRQDGQVLSGKVIKQ